MTHTSTMNTARPVLREFRAAAARSKADSQARRSRVLSYPDLAVRLTEPPLALARPRQWSGWIPPRHLAEAACSSKCPKFCTDQHTQINDSPIRTQLVDIARAALAREADTT